MGVSMSDLSQIWPPSPIFTEKNIPDQHGKVGSQLCKFSTQH
jgi:hypothetical protein